MNEGKNFSTSDYVIDILNIDHNIGRDTFIQQFIITKYGARLPIPHDVKVQEFDQIEISFKIHPDTSVRDKHRKSHEADLRKIEEQRQKILNRMNKEKEKIVELNGKKYKLIEEDEY